MDRERWQQVDRIFKAALELPTARRASFLDDACKGDRDLRREVESLIEHDRTGGFLETPVQEEAARIMSDGGNSTGGAAPEVGQTVGRYRVLKHLGAGGMGEVFLAEDAQLGRKVALKLLSAHLTDDSERISRFRQEALATSALNHPNIITIYEIGEWSGRDFIASEFVEGVTLRGLMRRKRLTLAGAIDIALQVAGALAAAHAAGVVHRDVKPENVMVRPDGLVKVLDFGIAKFTGPRRAREAFVKTATGTIVGTAAYMSPEQARGQETDARADIWSLGVILYEMVARRLPFPGNTPTDRLAAILEREPEPLSRARRTVPTELERIVSRALAKDKDARYVQVAEMAAELRKVRAQLGEARAPRFALPLPALGRGALPALRSRHVLFALAVLVFVATIFVWAIYFSRSLLPGADSPIDSLAVLPFQNATGDPESEYFSDGITESLINSLSELPNLRVMSRSSVFRYKGRTGDGVTLEAARQLSVRAVLTGRVTQRGDRLLVSVELTDAANNRHVWGQQYDHPMSDVLVVEQQITRDVTERLRLKLSGEQIDKATRVSTENPEAYRLYLRGRYEWHKFTPEALSRSIDYFNRAIALDPSYALAYAWLANAYNVRAHLMSPAEYYLKAEWAARKAVEIDPTLADAQAALGSIKLFNQWDWAGAESALRLAIQLNPNHPEARNLYAAYLTIMGRIDEAKTETLRAQENDPLSLFASAEMAQVFYFAREHDEAIAHARKGLELGPHLLLYHALARALVQKGLPLEAAAELRKGMEILGRNPTLMASLVHALASAGQRAEARKVLDEFEGNARQQYVSPYWLAVAYVGLGDDDRVFELLNRAADEHFFMLVWLGREPRFDRIRSDPRYPALVGRIGLPR